MNINEFIELVCEIDEDGEYVYYDETNDKKYYLKGEKILFFGYDDAQSYCRIKTEKDLYKVSDFWEHCPVEITN